MKALDSLRHLASEAGRKQIADAAEGMAILSQLERQSEGTEKRVAENIRKIADQETKLSAMKAEAETVEKALKALRLSSAKENKELQDQAVEITAEATERINQAQRAALKAETASKEALNALKDLESQIEERKVTLARLIA